MKTIALVVACGLAATATMTGCQQSGGADVDTESRPRARVEVSTAGSDTTTGTGAITTSGAGVSATGYTMTAVATRDTEWAAGADTTAARGTIRQGDRVMFNRAPDPSMEWQQARTSDGLVRYVRPADFRVTGGSR